MPMIRPADLPETLAVFPLPGALLLPRGRLPLHIFEPRYLAMIEDCLKTPARLIGMIQPRETPAGEPRLHSIGCAGRLMAFSETEDGRYMITLAGVSRFRILEELQGFTPYRRMRVDWSPFPRDMGPAETDPGLDRSALFALLSRFFDEQFSDHPAGRVGALHLAAAHKIARVHRARLSVAPLESGGCTVTFTIKTAG